jgi:hypothetical protein
MVLTGQNCGGGGREKIITIKKMGAMFFLYSWPVPPGFLLPFFLLFSAVLMYRQ